MVRCGTLEMLRLSVVMVSNSLWICERGREGEMVLKTLYNLNGFRESRTYVEGLSDIRFVGRGRSSDGYDEVDCYEQD